MLASEETRGFVGRPTIFVSHAWQYPFGDMVAALVAFAASLRGQGEGDPFFWFDTFSIDEHATQTLGPDWWDETFKEAIRMIGGTVMVLSPWDDPIPLTRSWCLWDIRL